MTGTDSETQWLKPRKLGHALERAFSRLICAVLLCCSVSSCSSPCTRKVEQVTCGSQGSGSIYGFSIAEIVITAVNEESGEVLQTQADRWGGYRLSSMPAGMYRLGPFVERVEGTQRTVEHVKVCADAAIWIDLVNPVREVVELAPLHPLP